MRRKIIRIDEDKCNGCGLCIPNCPEGALQIIDGKARIISDLYCDGLGACIGHCPKSAITIEARDAEPYDERKVMDNIIKEGDNTAKAHLQHLQEHNQNEYLKQAIDYLEEKGIKNPLLDTLGQETLNSKHKHPDTSLECLGRKIIDFREAKNGS